MNNDQMDYSEIGAIPVDDYSEIGAIPVENKDKIQDKRKMPEKPVDLFGIKNGNKSLFELNPDLKNPEILLHALPQAIGLTGMGLLPELSILKGASFAPRALNALSNMGVQGSFGAMANPEHPLIGAIGGAALNPFVKGMKGLYSLGKNALSTVLPEEIGSLYQKGHDLLKKSAEDIFEHVGKSYKDRGLPPVKIDQKLIDDVSTHMPETDAAKALLEKARMGDYPSLRKLQTQLFHYGTKAQKSNIPTESIRGEEIMDLRNKINKSIFDHLIKTGNMDMAKSLGEGMTKYRNLHKTYYAKKLPASLKNMVHEESREIPANIGTLLSKKSVPVNRILNSDPDVLDLVKKYESNRNALKKLKYLGSAGITAGILGGLAALPSDIQKIRNIFD